MYIDNYGRIMPGDPNELYHHGVVGMHWGIRRYQPYPDGYYGDGRFVGKKSNREQAITEIVNSRHYTRNIESLGKDPTHNVLFITGLSGSGKSTLAQKFKDDNKIHLDYYFEKGDPKEDLKYQDREFNDYLDKKGIRFRDIKKLDNKNPEKWKIVDQMGDAIIEFSKDQYKKNKMVIVEGVEIANEAMYPNKRFFDDKPLVVLETSSVKSLRRGLARDGISPFDIACIAERIKYQKNWKQDLKTLKIESSTLVKRVNSLRSSGLSYAQIAKKLKIPESSVGYYLNL